MTKQESGIQTLTGGISKVRRRPVLERLLAGMDLEERLKAERVEEMVRLMPGWGVQAGGRSIDRVREFADSCAAAKYAAFVQDSAGAGNIVVSTLRWDNRVLVTIFGKRRRRSFETLTPRALRFALTLG